MPNIFRDFPENVTREFIRRTNDYGINLSNEVDSDGIGKYRGGRTPWMRIASGVVYDSDSNTSTGDNTKLSSNRVAARGIVLEPQVTNFRNYYGIDDERQFIARAIDASGLGITKSDINTINDRNQPGPIIDNITVESKGDMGLTRTAEFTFKAFTQEQFDILTDFFCIAGKTVVLEWGWNTFFNRNDAELLELNDPAYIKAIASGKSFRTIQTETVSTLIDDISGLPTEQLEYNSPKVQALYNTIRSKNPIYADNMTPYEALMELGNTDYDIFIGIVTNYDIKVPDGVYEVTVHLRTKGESFLNLTNNESGLKSYFENSDESGFRKFIIDNRKTDPRIWSKDVEDINLPSFGFLSNSSDGDEESDSESRSYSYGDDERLKIKEIADVFFNVQPLYFGVNEAITDINEEIKHNASIPPPTKEELTSAARLTGTAAGREKSTLRTNSQPRTRDVYFKTPNLRNNWGSDFADSILKFMYVSDKNLIELFNRNGKLVVNWKSVLPESDADGILSTIFTAPERNWGNYRSFLLNCYLTAEIINDDVPEPDFLLILGDTTPLTMHTSTGSGIPLKDPHAAFEGNGYSAKGQISPAHIRDFWNTPNLLNVIRYYLEIEYQKSIGTYNNVTGSTIFTAGQLSNLSPSGIPSSQKIFTDLNSDVKKIRDWLYVGLGVTKEQVRSAIGRYVSTTLNPFVQKSFGLPLEEKKPSFAFDGDIGNDEWGDDSVSYILSALRVQKSSFSGTIQKKVDDAGTVSTGNTNILENNRSEPGYTYITVGLLEEIINRRILGTPTGIIDSSDTKLWFHTNLISSDKNTCIIPNESAPRYNTDNINEKLDPEAPTVDLAIKGITHRNHPQKSPDDSVSELNDSGEGEMYLYSIFVNTNIIERVFSNTADLYDALIEVMGYVNGAVGRRYDFKLQRTGDSVQIIDLNNPKNMKYSGLYIFPYNTKGSFIKNLDISLSLPDQIAIQAFTSNIEEGTTRNLISGNEVAGDLYQLGSSIEPPVDTGDDRLQPVSTTSCFYEHQYLGSKDVNNTGFSIGKHEGPIVNYVYPHQGTININTATSGSDDTFPIPNSELDITIDGISGIQFFNVFNVVFIPRRLRQIGRFFVKGLNHTITTETWDTSVNSQYMVVPNKYWNKDDILDEVDVGHNPMIFRNSPTLPNDGIGQSGNNPAL